MIQMNLPMKQNHKYREQTDGCQWEGVKGGMEGVRGGMEGEAGIGRCKLLYKEWIKKILLFSRELYSITYDKPQLKRIF